MKLNKNKTVLYSHSVLLRQLQASTWWLTLFHTSSCSWLVVIWCDMLGDIQSRSNTLPWSRYLLPCQVLGGRPATGKTFQHSMHKWDVSHLPQHHFVVWTGEHILLLILTPSLSYISPPFLSPRSSSFPPTLLSSVCFPFLFYYHASPFSSSIPLFSSIFFFSVPPSLLPLLPPSPLLPPDTPLFCAAGVRILRRDHHSLS